MASSRTEDVPSQSFIDGANSSHRNEEVETGALWKIQRSTERKKKIKTQTDNGPHLTYVAEPQWNLPVFKFSHFHGVFLILKLFERHGKILNLKFSSLLETILGVYSVV